jgi:hypothetical protein
MKTATQETHLESKAKCAGYLPCNKNVELSRNRPWRPIGLRDVKDHTLSRQSAYGWRLSDLRTGRALLPRNMFVCFWYSFLLEADWTPGPSMAGGIRLLEQINSPYRVLNPRSSGLKHGALTITLPNAPI